MQAGRLASNVQQSSFKRNIHHYPLPFFVPLQLSRVLSNSLSTSLLLPLSHVIPFVVLSFGKCRVMNINDI